MPGTIANPRVWVGADVATAPLGTTAPTDPTTALAVGFKSVGLLSEDGLTITPSETTTDYFAYGGLPIRTVRSKFKREFKFICLEDNLVVFGLVNPGSTAVTASSITTRSIKMPTPNPSAFCATLIDGTVNKRLLIPRGEAVNPQPFRYVDSELTMFTVTVNVYAASDGTFYKEITDDPQAVTP